MQPRRSELTPHLRPVTDGVPVWEREGTLAKAERDAIADALAVTNWNISEAARRLHIGRSTVNRLMAKYDLCHRPERERRADRRVAEAEKQAGVERARPRPDPIAQVVQINGDWFIVKNGAAADE